MTGRERLTAGKVHIVHMCGKLRGLTGQVASGKMDGIDSVCPPENLRAIAAAVKKFGVPR